MYQRVLLVSVYLTPPPPRLRQVRNRDGHEDAGRAGQTGVVRSVSGAMCSLFLPDEDRVVNMTADQLEPVQPQRGDSVKVILGQSTAGRSLYGGRVKVILGQSAAGRSVGGDSVKVILGQSSAGRSHHRATGHTHWYYGSHTLGQREGQGHPRSVLEPLRHTALHLRFIHLSPTTDVSCRYD